MATQPVLRGRSADITAAGVPAGRIYVWEIPVRLTHWVNALSIVMLSFTGYYIARPYLAISHRRRIAISSWATSALPTSCSATSFWPA